MKRNIVTSVVYMLFIICICGCTTEIDTAPVIPKSPKDPPFGGTIFIDPDIIIRTDPTTFQGVSSIGQESRMMFDRRVDAWVNVNAYLFIATFSDDLSIEIQVNPEFSHVDAGIMAGKYAEIIGQLPQALRADVKTVSIHEGTEPFGGGNNNLLIHTGQSDEYESQGILEETFIHEAAHTSLDAKHSNAANWVAAQEADASYISTYARDFPFREDVAESFLLYFAFRYRSDRITQGLSDTISQTIPNRIDYFDQQSFNMHPQE